MEKNISVEVTKETRSQSVLWINRTSKLELTGWTPSITHIQLYIKGFSLSTAALCQSWQTRLSLAWRILTKVMSSCQFGPSQAQRRSDCTIRCSLLKVLIPRYWYSKKMITCWLSPKRLRRRSLSIQTAFTASRTGRGHTNRKDEGNSHVCVICDKVVMFWINIPVPASFCGRCDVCWAQDVVIMNKGDIWIICIIWNLNFLQIWHPIPRPWLRAGWGRWWSNQADFICPVCLSFMLIEFLVFNPFFNHETFPRKNFESLMKLWTQRKQCQRQESSKLKHLYSRIFYTLKLKWHYNVR